MRKMTYLAIFEPNNNGGYGVSFPDLPGCISYGDSFEAAQREAQDALGLHLYAMEQDGDKIPKPAQTPDIDPEMTAGYLISPVSVFPDLVRNELDNRRVKTNVTIPAWVKSIAQEQNLNCSKLLEAAILDVSGVRPLPPNTAHPNL